MLNVHMLSRAVVKNNQRENWGTAQRETTRRRKPDCMGLRQFKRFETPLLATPPGECTRISMHWMHSVDFGWVNIGQLNFVVSELKFTFFFLSNMGGLQLITPFSNCRHLDPFRRCKWSNVRLSEIASNCGRLFAIQNFRGVGPRNLYPSSCLLRGTSRGKDP